MARAYGWQELSGAERGLIDAIEEGRDFWPASDADAKQTKARAAKTILAAGHIRAEIIRAILLGFAFERRQPRQASEWRPVAIPPSGLRIRPPSLAGGAPVDRVRILGDLNLHGLTGQGGVVMPPILLEYCDFDGALDLRAISVAALSLQGSRFSALNGSDADIRGPLNLSWVEPYVAPQGAAGEGPYTNAELDELWPFAGNSFVRKADKLANIIGADFEPQAIETPRPDRALPMCVASFANATIDGNVAVRGARFVRMPDDRDPFDPEAQTLLHALTLRGAIITGSVQLVRSLCIGGCLLSYARVEEDVWVQDCRLIAMEGQDAVEMQTASVGGIVGFCDSAALGQHASTLHRLRSDFSVNVVLGRMHLLGLRARYLWIDNIVQHAGGGSFGEPSANLLINTAITITNAEISDSIWLGAYGGGANPAHEAAILGAIDLTSTKVGSSLQISYLGDVANGADAVPSLVPMESAFVRDRLGYASNYLPNFCVLNLQNTVVGDGVTIDNCRLSAVGFQDIIWSSALRLEKGDVGRGLTIGANVELSGSLRLTSSRIGRSVKIECRSIDALRNNHAIPTAIDLSQLVVDGDVCIGAPARQGIIGGMAAMTIRGAMRMEDSRIASKLAIARCEFTIDTLQYSASLRGALQSSDDFPDILSLVGTAVQGRLEVKDCHWTQSKVFAPLAPPVGQGDAPASAQVNRAIVDALGDKNISGVEVRQLDFLDDYLTIDILHSEGGDDGDTEPAWRERFLFDARSQRAILLGGDNQSIYAATADSSRFHLLSEEAERNYLTFFCATLKGDEGSFRLVRDVGADAVVRGDPDAVVDDSAPRTPPEEILQNLPLGGLDRKILDDGRIGYYATVVYGGHIFNALFALGASGWVEMLFDLAKAALKETPPPSPKRGLPIAAPDGIELFDFGSPEPLSQELGQLFTPGPVESGSMQPASTPVVGAQVPVQNLPVAIRLEQFKCGLLDDDYGRGWNLAPHILLHLSGLYCSDVEPAGDAAKPLGDDSPNKSEAPEPSGREADVEGAPDAWPLAKSLTPTFESNVTDTKGISAARSRADWLKYQFVQLPVKAGLLNWLRQKSLPARWRGHEDVCEEDFVPQTWDVFANAYMRAGEMAASRDLMAERKDIEAKIFAQRIRLWGSRGNAAADAGKGRAARAAPYMLLGIILSAAAVLAAYYLRWPQPFALDDWRALLLIGSAVTALVVLAAPWLLLFGALLFRAGFKYGLSVPRAIVTFLICIGVGALGTHMARTGSAISLTTNWDALRAADGTPEPQIALVLATNYGVDVPTPAPAGPGSIPGDVVYGRAAFCNLGVSSWQYAMDVFIPVLDLDQESRCSIREENEAVGSYNFWRWLKILYEMLGWVVTSLTILTITGVMRRDMERN